MKIERLDFDIKSNHPIFAWIILFFMLPKFIVKANIYLKLCNSKLKYKTIYYVPRFKVIKDFED